MTAAERKPHPHAKFFQALADGEQIEFRNKLGGVWKTLPDVHFGGDTEYRIKPEREYPETLMTQEELNVVWCAPNLDPRGSSCKSIANAAIRHAIDADQVVPKSEVLEVARQLSAKHEMTIAEVVYLACVTVVERFSGSTARELKKAIDLSKIVAGVNQ